MYATTERAGVWRRLTTAILAAAVALTLTVAGGLPAAQAADPPTGMIPSGTEQAGLPVLSWDRVPDATGYRVEVAADSSFGTLLWSQNTVNRQAVPNVQLPRNPNQVWWRVRSTVAGEASAWSTTSFTISGVSGPVLLSPAPDAELEQPDEPVLLTWSPVSGASRYSVEISTDPLFVDESLIDTFSTKGSSYLVQSPGVATPYYWRVRAVLGTNTFTLPSEVRSYTVLPLDDAVRTAPSPDGAEVDDAVLDWQPIPGAKTYDLQISTDENFLSIIHSATGITGTRYARPETLGNDEFYWRVRGANVNGLKKNFDLSPVWRFQRAWRDQPDLVYPANDAVVGDPFYFQWTPTTLASRYVIEMSPNAGFTPESSVTRCSTVNTTFNPMPNCWPGDNGSYYWRVLAIDEFNSDNQGPRSDLIASEVSRFTYRSERVALLTPEAGETVTVPTLTWEPRAGAAMYKVTITALSPGASGASIETAATSFTPQSQLQPGSYRWDVQPISEDGRMGSALIQSSQRSFTVAAYAPTFQGTPDPQSPLSGTYKRFPTLTWTPVTGASHYRILVRPFGGTGWTMLDGQYFYHRGEDTGTEFLAAGEYEWMIEAYNGPTAISSTPHDEIARFTIAAPDEVAGHRAALTGTALDSGETCAATLPAECQNLRQTPVLRWTPADDAGYYLLYLSDDRELTEVLPNYPVKVYSSQWTPPTTLADSQAGSAYFWHVRPCAADGVCAPLAYADHAFNKMSNPVDLGTGPGITYPLTAGSPAVPVVQDDVTLSWQDYLASNTAAPQGETPLVTKSTTEARKYRVQVSTDPTFQTGLLDNVDVDQRSYTSFGQTYPEGPIYWRVHAYDGNQRPLQWSETRTFEKRSPTPILVSPLTGVGETVPGNTPLRWEALSYAASYRVEVYRNNDTMAQPANQVLAASTTQISYATDEPLPKSEQPYVWRVRRVDAKNRNGAWSDWGSFMVSGTAPELTAPAGGAYVPPSDALFTWQPTDGTASYRYERRLVGATSATETVNTPATAWATPTKLADGNWEWRVSSLDTSGAVLGSSAWRAFSVSGTPVATLKPRIEGSGAVGSILASQPPTWNLDGVTNSYQWLRNNSPIAGATEESYTLTTADLGKSISLRVTGSLPGYTDGVTTSDPITISAGPAPTVVTPPTISGSGQVGTMLIATAPTWSTDGVTTTNAWLRDGVKISNATGATYVVTLADVGHAIRLQVTGKKTGYADAVAASNVITGVLGAALAPSSPPMVTGKGEVGQTLTATGGLWPSGTKLTYQWLRDGAPITGATGTSYTLVSTDAMKPISVLVTGSKSGFANGTAASAPVQIAKMRSATFAELSGTTVKKGAKVIMKITVSVSGLKEPIGTILVKDRRKKLKKLTLKPTHTGVISFRLPLLKKGNHRIRAFYLGTLTAMGSKSKSIKLVVK